MENSRNCVGCNAVIEVGSSFCAYCGTEFEMTDSEGSVVLRKEPTAEYKRKFALVEEMVEHYFAGRKVSKNGEKGFDAVIQYYSEAELEGGDEQVLYWISLSDFFAKGYSHRLAIGEVELLSKKRFMDLVESFMDNAVEAKIIPTDLQKLRQEMDKTLHTLSNELDRYPEKNPASEVAFQEVGGLKKLFRKNR